MNLTFYYWSLGAAVMSLVVIRKLNNEVIGMVMAETHTRESTHGWKERRLEAIIHLRKETVKNTSENDV